MLPANPSQGKRDVGITVSPIKPGKNSIHMAKPTTKLPEEMRFVPIAPKPVNPCSITISNYNINHNINCNSINTSKKINNAPVIKKLTPINVLQKQLKSNNNLTIPAPPLIQLVPSTNANGNANSLLSILTQKTLLNPTCAKSNNQAQSQSQVQLQQPQSLLIQPATATTVTSIPVVQQQQAQQQLPKTAFPGTAAASTQTQVINMVASKGPVKSTSTTPPGTQISLLSKPRTPVILSKAAVEKIRLKFGQVQAQASSGGSLILSKSVKASSSNTFNNSNANNNSINNSKSISNTNAKPSQEKSSEITADTVSSSLPTPMPMPMPMPIPMPTATAATIQVPLPLAMTCNALPEIRISPLPPVTLNGTKLMKVQTNPLTVIVPEMVIQEPKAVIATPAPAPPTAAAETTAAATTSASTLSALTTITKGTEQIGSPKLQRSKSLAGNEDTDTVILLHTNGAERRHSVAIMAKEVDVVEQPIPIETITIDDDDSEDERIAEQKQQQQQQKPKPQQQLQQPKPQQQQQQLPKPQQQPKLQQQQQQSRPQPQHQLPKPQLQQQQQKPVQLEEQKPKLQQQTAPQQQQGKSSQQQQKKNPAQKQQQKLQRPQRQSTSSSTQSSRKNSTASRSSIASNSSSDLEMIIVPCDKSEQPQSKPLPEKHVVNSAINNISIVKAETLAVSKEEFEKSLRCDELVDKISPTSSEYTSNTSTTKSANFTHTPISRLQEQRAEPSPMSSMVLGDFKRRVQQTFGTLRWREKQQLQNSTMRFELNRYNLLQLAERCEPRQAPASYFEKALFERRVRRPINASDPLLYLCSRCNCHGPASDFLAPKFCSVSCVRRAHKRRQVNLPSSASECKISRMQDTKVHNGHEPQHQVQLRDKDRQREHRVEASKPPFRWTEYLKAKGSGEAAPIHLFLNPFPINPNCFKRGMKLEAIDPENCSLFCVCTIVEVRGYRIKLNFDGYANMYDFWVNADSMDIFPPGWCERTSRILQVPKGYSPDRFNWYRYLVKTNAKAAPAVLFTHLNTPKHVQINYFTVGMHLEAEDLNDTGKICVATIADILDERIRVHFDGWDDCYDFWVHINSPYIHPCGWHEGRQQLIVPPDYHKIVFSWPEYIKETGGIAAPLELFKPREPMEYQTGMKLEVVDQRNPSLIRPATVVTRKGYRVQLHLDCWRPEYYFWLEDDSPDLHPIGWCEATSHELEAPPGFQQSPSLMPCDVAGCRGFGNAKRFNLNVHALSDCCPYAPDNWRQWRSKTVKPPRVQPEHIKRAASPKPLAKAQSQPQPKGQPQPKAQAQPQPNSVLQPQLDVKPQIAVEPSPILRAQLHTNAKPASVKIKTSRKSERSRQSLDSEPKPKLKREEPTPIEPKRTESVPKAPLSSSVQVNQRSMSIAKSIVAEYGPQYARNYRLWQKNSDFDMNQLRSNPLYWTNWDVYEFVERALKSSAIARLLFDEEIDGRALLMLGRQDLANFFKLKVGPTVKLFSLIVNLRIAVACKFQTKESGLNYNQAKQSILKGKQEPLDTKKQPKIEPKQKRESVKIVSVPVASESDEDEENGENDDDMEADDEDDVDFDCKEEANDDDDEDVVLDSDDFLSVKPIHSIVKNGATLAPQDTDVVMTPLDALPVTAS